jgi:SAM-dependent methyltransferase
VISLETLEHVADPIRAVQEMYRVLRPGGVLAISSLMFFPIHAHPWDYWRFTPEGFELLLQPFESKLVVAQGWDLMPEGVFGIAVKGPATLTPEHLPRTMNIARSWDGGKRVDLGPMRLSVRELWKLTLRHSIAAARDRVGRSAP